MSSHTSATGAAPERFESAISLMVFDLDGALAPNKSAIDDEMGALLAELLERTSVAVMSGADVSQFLKTSTAEASGRCGARAALAPADVRDALLPARRRLTRTLRTRSR